MLNASAYSVRRNATASATASAIAWTTASTTARTTASALRLGLVLELLALAACVAPSQAAQWPAGPAAVTLSQRQEQAELAERAQVQAIEARSFGRRVQACALDRLALQGLSLAYGGLAEGLWSLDLISAQRNVAVCQEDNL